MQVVIQLLSQLKGVTPWPDREHDAQSLQGAPYPSTDDLQLALLDYDDCRGFGEYASEAVRTLNPDTMESETSTGVSGGSSPHSAGKRTYSLAFNVDAYEAAPSVYSTPLQGRSPSPVCTQANERLATPNSTPRKLPHSIPANLSSPKTPSNRPTKGQKTLQLRSNGTLISPSTGSSAPPPPKRQRRKQPGRSKAPVLSTNAASSEKSVREQKIERHARKKIAQPNQKMVAIHYGKRGTAADRIVEILSSSPTGPSSANSSGSKESQIIEKSRQAQHALHPFFDGKNSTPKPAHLIAIKEASPRRQGQITARVCSKPPSAYAWPPKPDSREVDIIRPAASMKLRGLGGSNCPWPAQEQVHVRNTGIERLASAISESSVEVMRNAIRKLKARETIDGSHTLKRYARSVQIHGRSDGAAISKTDRQLPLKTRWARLDLQKDLLKRLSAEGVHSCDNTALKSSSQGSESSELPRSPIARLWFGLAYASSAYDRGHWETQSWTDKYAPQTSQGFLSSQREMRVLCEWLGQMKVAQHRTTPQSIKHLNQKQSGDEAMAKGLTAPLRGDRTERRKRKQKKRKDEFGDFIISSDEEAEQMTSLEELTDGSEEHNGGTLRSRIRSLYPTVEKGDGGALRHVILISGPHGTGKSAAVYASAREVGFEVFEINPGKRRSGPDILERVGSMARNHQVGGGPSAPVFETGGSPPSTADLDVEADVASGAQKTMNSFFKAGRPKPKPAQESMPKQQPARSPTTKSKGCNQNQQSQYQRQSLILLEEVDILFAEDERFWITVIMLIKESKRPIIMTCSDESLVPLECIPLQALLRFRAPDPEILIDYLLLIVAHEGHILERAPVRELVRSRNSDIRATITTLQFWCQMGVGSKKGGIDWLPDHRDGLEDIRSISSGTFSGPTETIRSPSTADPPGLNNPTERLVDNILEKAEDQNANPLECLPELRPTLELDASVVEGQSYKVVSSILEASSVADLLSSYGLQDDRQSHMDCSLPPPSEKTLQDRIMDVGHVDAVPLTDYSSLAAQLSIHICVSAQPLLHSYGLTLARHHQTPEQQSARAQDLRSSVSSLEKSVTFPPVLSIFPQLSITSLAVEISPYARAIVRSDLALSEQRVAASGLLTFRDHMSRWGEAPRADDSKREDVREPEKKKLRLTRAALSAMEGGVRGEKRRERWFGKGIHAEAILGTGGEAWDRAALNWLDAH